MWRLGAKFHVIAMASKLYGQLVLVVRLAKEKGGENGELLILLSCFFP